MPDPSEYVVMVPAAVHESRLAQLQNEIEQHKESLSIALGQLETMRGRLAECERERENSLLQLRIDKRNLEQERDVLAAKLRAMARQ